MEINNLSNRKCHLEGILFLNIIPLILSGISLITLIFKRNQETHPRLWLNWSFDISKQIIGAVFNQFLNWFLCIFIFTKDDKSKYAWYVVNIFIDSTLGTVLVFSCHHSLFRLCKSYLWKNDSYSKIGYYGQPPDYRICLSQLIPYLICLLINKLITLVTLSPHYSLLVNLENQILNSLSFQQFSDIGLMVNIMICFWVLMTFQLWIFDFIFQSKYLENEKIDENKDILMTESPTQTLSFKSNNTPPRLNISTDEDISDTETQITI